MRRKRRWGRKRGEGGGEGWGKDGVEWRGGCGKKNKKESGERKTFIDQAWG